MHSCYCSISHDFNLRNCQQEVMKMMGMSEIMNWLSWMVNTMLVLTISITIVTVILSMDLGNGRGSALKETDWFILWVFLVLYAFASVTFCFAIAAFMQKRELFLSHRN